VTSFYVENFGCRATQADGAAIEGQLRECGLQPASTSYDAQVVVLNTCTVTAAADQDARAAIRRIRRQNPECKIVITGCYAQRAPEELASLPGVDLVIGNSHKHRLAQIAVSRLPARQPGTERYCERAFVPISALAMNRHAGAHLDGGQTSAIFDRLFVSDIFAHTELLAAPVFDSARDRTRPNLKVQDGCDNRCSFCVIPYVRGQSRSMPMTEVLRQIDFLVSAGYREVVISGINLGRWGRDLKPLRADDAEFDLQASRDQRAGASPRFEDLVRAILDRTALEKLRISSVEPMDWSDELIALVAGSVRIAKHAHVPMQSGSDRVLRQMHRKYRPWHYREKIEKIRLAMPGAAIGADVMVGFPGETDADFEQTRRMVEDLPFTYLHVFTYSARPGTPAAFMKNQVPASVARQRNRVLQQLASEKKLAFMRSFVGSEIPAISLDRYDGEHTEALTDNYLKLRLRGKHEPNRWISAVIDKVSAGTLLGRMQAS
jgi:threonylcarbamoyladenosine tRNA methylthiotransferase MtaB